MARDYAKTRSSANKKKKRSRTTPAAKRKQKKAGGLPAWVWLFCGLCIGLVVAAGVYVFGRPAGQPGIQVRAVTPNPETTQTAPQEAAPEQAESKAAQEPRFDFYKMLPNYEVVIPQPADTQTTTPESQPAPQYEQPGQYVVQVGSFREYARADRLRAKIGLLGIESEIHQAQLSGGTTVYRVRTKLIDGPSKLNHILEKLHASDVRTLIMRRND